MQDIYMSPGACQAGAVAQQLAERKDRLEQVPHGLPKVRKSAASLYDVFTIAIVYVFIL